jgi:DNA-binding FadR family transcriptional regulator
MNHPSDDIIFKLFRIIVRGMMSAYHPKGRRLADIKQDLVIASWINNGHHRPSHRPMSEASLARLSHLPRSAVRTSLRFLEADDVILHKRGGYCFNPKWLRANPHAAFLRRIIYAIITGGDKLRKQ